MILGGVQMCVGGGRFRLGMMTGYSISIVNFNWGIPIGVCGDG